MTNTSILKVKKREENRIEIVFLIFHKKIGLSNVTLLSCSRYTQGNKTFISLSLEKLSSAALFPTKLFQLTMDDFLLHKLSS